MKIGAVDTRDISIVVQGPIIRNVDYYPNGWTDEVLKRLRRHFPDSEIILSTWRGTDVEGLTFDILVENEDPGQTYYNLNRQIISTRNGLEKATRRYAMKWRTDTVLKSNQFLEYFARFPIRDRDYSILRERILLPTARDPRFSRTPFAYSDYYHFGLIEDLKAIWSIPPAPEEWTFWFSNRPKPKLAIDNSRYTPEQYIWITFLKSRMNIECDHSFDCDKRKIELHEKIAANNFILIDLNMGHIEWIRFPGNKKTGERLPPRSFMKRKFDDCLQSSLSYDHKSWRLLYESNCVKKKSFLAFFRYYIYLPAKASLFLGIKKSKQIFQWRRGYESRKIK